MARILVVDDEPDSLLSAKAALGGAGHQCVLAADGERALEQLGRGGFDVLVIDPAMRLHDGWAVLAAATVPVVVVSAVAPPGRAGDDRGYVRKPFGGPDLCDAVASALGR